MVLDLTGALVIVLIFAQAGPPELLFHVVFVILTIEAFTFGRRVTLRRIVACSVALIGYALTPAMGIHNSPLELSEWPLMFTIAVLVAWMADREQSAARRYADLYRRAHRRLETAHEEERRRLSRDLHDGVGQLLTAIVLTLDAAAGAADLRTVRQRTRRAHELAAEALEETRTAAERVRPPRFEERGVASALHELAHHAGLPAVVDIEPAADVRIRPLELEIDLFRIAQEAVSNAARHAQATSVRLALRRTGRGLELEISDDGVGFDEHMVDARGLGLTGMRERAATIGAEFRLESAPGRGTHVRVVVPARRMELAEGHRGQPGPTVEEHISTAAVTR